MSNFFDKIRAFSLLEMMMVLLVSTTLIGGGVFIYNKKSEADKVADTMEKLEFIKKAYMDFIRVNLYAPCPVDSSVNYFTSGSYGVSAMISTGDGCNGPLAHMGTVSEPSISAGPVPYHTLNIPEKYTFDGWGRPISIALAGACSGVHKLDSTAYFTETNNNLASPYLINHPRRLAGITGIADARCGDLASFSPALLNAASETTNVSLAAIVYYSHGKNGFGSIKLDGTGRYVPANTNSFSAEERLNAFHNGTALTFNSRRFALTNINLQETTTTYRDDLLIYLSRGELRKESGLLLRSAGTGSAATHNPVCLKATEIQTVGAWQTCSDANCLSAIDQMSRMILSICF